MDGEGLEVVETLPMGPKKGRKKKPPPSAAFDEYSREDMSFFLSLVEQSRVIWDSKHQFYHRCDVKMRTFDGIEQSCTKFMPRGKVHGKCAETIWQSLQTAYVKDANKVKTARSGSGTPSYEFPFEKEMSFLKEDRDNRSVKNAFIIGGDEDNLLETFETKKVTPSRKRNNQFDEMMIGMEQANKMICRALMTAVDDEKPTPTPSGCVNERVCRVLSSYLADKTEVEKILAESKIINFISALDDKKEPTPRTAPQDNQFQFFPMESLDDDSNLFY